MNWRFGRISAGTSMKQRASQLASLLLFAASFVLALPDSISPAGTGIENPTCEPVSPAFTGLIFSLLQGLRQSKSLPVRRPTALIPEKLFSPFAERPPWPYPPETEKATRYWSARVLTDWGLLMDNITSGADVQAAQALADLSSKNNSKISSRRTHSICWAVPSNRITTSPSRERKPFRASLSASESSR